MEDDSDTEMADYGTVTCAQTAGLERRLGGLPLDSAARHVG